MDAADDNETSPEVRFLDETRFWIQRVFLPIIGTVGIFGNFATIIVLTRRGMRTSTHSYLSALAIADLIYLVCVLWLSLRHYPNLNNNSIWNFTYSHVWPYSIWLADATTNTSVWLTVTFTLERCIAIAYPIKGRVLFTVSRAKKLIVCIYFICFTTTMSTPFEWTVKEKTDPVTNTSIYEIATTNLGEMRIYRTVYYWFTSITFVLLPLTLLIVFNSFLIHSFRRSQKLRRSMVARQKLSEEQKGATTHEMKITGTLIAVVIMFIVCQLPTAATLIYQIFHVTKLTSNEETILRALGNIFNFLVSLNAASNFILYCGISEKYRRTFTFTFLRCHYQSPSSAHSNKVILHHQQAEESNDGNQFIFSNDISSFLNHGSHSNYSIPLMTIKTTPPHHELYSKYNSRMPTSTTGIGHHPTSNSCILTLPVIYENEPSSDFFPSSNSLPSRTVVILHNPPSIVKSGSIGHHESMLSLARNRSIDPHSSPTFPSWPDNLRDSKSIYSKPPFEGIRRKIISVIKIKSNQDFALTSTSV